MLVYFKINCEENTALKIAKATIIYNHYNLISNNLHEFLTDVNLKTFGFREKDILRNLKSVNIKQNDEKYLLLTFSNGESFFDYECYSNRITA